MSFAVTEGIGYGDGWHYKLNSIDIKRAYFWAPARRDIYVRLPLEDLEEGMCGKLDQSMYGTQDAAFDWEIEYTEFMIKCGFVEGKSTPCLFKNPAKDLCAVIYGEDFTLLGSETMLDWFEQKKSKLYEIDHEARLGPDPHDDKAVRLLNRVITWTIEGVELEADQRH